jgi:hypothetical protein
MSDSSKTVEGQPGVVIRVARAEEGNASMDVTKVAGIATGIAFVIGVLYDVGYFTALDLQLFPLLSYKDHLETLVFFVPIAIVPIVLCLGLRRKPAGRTTANIAAGVLVAVTLISWLERSGLVGLSAIIVVRVAAVTAFMVVVYCAALLIEKLLDMSGGPDTDRMLVISIAGLGVLLFVVVLGNLRGHVDAGGASFDTDITLTGEGDDKPEMRSARIVRAIDGGLLLVFKDAPDKLAYVRYETVRTIAEPLRP